MPYLLLGLAVLVLFLVARRSFAKANPAILAQQIRKMGGILALMGAVLLSFTGKFIAAVPLAIFGLGLLKKGVFAGFPFPGGAPKSQGQRSRVRTEYLEMILDHDSGGMDGRILKGRYRNKDLSELSLAILLSLWQDWRGQDQQSARLIEAYLDQNHTDWREKAGYFPDDEQDSAGPSSAAGGGRMTVDEAYDILGLTHEASRADIQKSHRALMKKVHPDQGGSTYLAAKINQAKDLLLDIVN